MSSTDRPALVWAGQAIMQGKLVLSQSLSTVLFMNLFCMEFDLSNAGVATKKWSRMARDHPARVELLQSKVGNGSATDGDLLRLHFLAFVPGSNGVLPIRH